MTRIARLLVGVSCGLTLAVAMGGAASAARLSSSSQPFTVGWVPTFTNAFGRVSCEDIRLTGSFHSRTFAKVARSLLGYINGATITEPARCSGGTVRLLTETLPWHFRYGSFSGTLPRITAIRFEIIGFAISMTASGIPCLYRSSAASAASITANLEAGGVVSSVTAGGTIPETGGFCGTATLSGSGSGPNQIRWTLI